MANWSWFTKLHGRIYEKTDGRLMARLAGLEMCLLTTTGRKSGQPRTLPLACFRDGDDVIVVGSNNGQDHDPAWWLNLQANPEAAVRLGRERFRARAELATGAERERLWPWLCEKNPVYPRYAKKTQRQIPVVVLKRAHSGTVA
jgi:deazaflavin-dependent oxidoreductase (nitroreductase family)